MTAIYFLSHKCPTAAADTRPSLPDGAWSRAFSCTHFYSFCWVEKNWHEEEIRFHVTGDPSYWWLVPWFTTAHKVVVVVVYRQNKPNLLQRLRTRDEKLHLMDGAFTCSRVYRFTAMSFFLCLRYCPLLLRLLTHFPRSTSLLSFFGEKIDVVASVHQLPVAAEPLLLWLFCFRYVRSSFKRLDPLVLQHYPRKNSRFLVIARRRRKNKTSSDWRALSPAVPPPPSASSYLVDPLSSLSVALVHNKKKNEAAAAKSEGNKFLMLFLILCKRGEKKIPKPHGSGFGLSLSKDPKQKQRSMEQRPHCTALRAILIVFFYNVATA